MEHLVTRPALPRIVTVLGLLFVCLGATTTGNSCSIRDFLKGGSNNDQNFAVSLALINTSAQETDSFAFGEDIEMQLTVRNTDDTNTAELQFPTTRTSDFVVLNQGSDSVLWKDSTHEPVAAQTLTTLTFQPSETKTFTVTWNQVGDSNVALNPGTYDARGVLVFDDFDISPTESNNLGSPIKTFTIRRP
jgi:hypothetical protein